MKYLLLSLCLLSAVTARSATVMSRADGTVYHPTNFTAANVNGPAAEMSEGTFDVLFPDFAARFFYTRSQSDMRFMTWGSDVDFDQVLRFSDGTTLADALASIDGQIESAGSSRNELYEETERLWYADGVQSALIAENTERIESIPTNAAQLPVSFSTSSYGASGNVQAHLEAIDGVLSYLLARSMTNSANIAANYAHITNLYAQLEAGGITNAPPTNAPPEEVQLSYIYATSSDTNNWYGQSVFFDVYAVYSDGTTNHIEETNAYLTVSYESALLGWPSASNPAFTNADWGTYGHTAATAIFDTQFNVPEYTTNDAAALGLPYPPSLTVRFVYTDGGVQKSATVCGTTIDDSPPIEISGQQIRRTLNGSPLDTVTNAARSFTATLSPGDSCVYTPLASYAQTEVNPGAFTTQPHIARFVYITNQPAFADIAAFSWLPSSTGLAFTVKSVADLAPYADIASGTVTASVDILCASPFHLDQTWPATTQRVTFTIYSPSLTYDTNVQSVSVWSAYRVYSGESVTPIARARLKTGETITSEEHPELFSWDVESVSDSNRLALVTNSSGAQVIATAIPADFAEQIRIKATYGNIDSDGFRIVGLPSDGPEELTAINPSSWVEYAVIDDTYSYTPTLSISVTVRRHDGTTFVPSASVVSWGPVNNASGGVFVENYSTGDIMRAMAFSEAGYSISETWQLLAYYDYTRNGITTTFSKTGYLPVSLGGFKWQE